MCHYVRFSHICNIQLQLLCVCVCACVQVCVCGCVYVHTHMHNIIQAHTDTHRHIPNIQTSLEDVNLRKLMLSGAIHLIGSIPFEAAQQITMNQMSLLQTEPATPTNIIITFLQPTGQSKISQFDTIRSCHQYISSCNVSATALHHYQPHPLTATSPVYKLLSLQITHGSTELFGVVQ